MIDLYSHDGAGKTKINNDYFSDNDFYILSRDD